MKEGKKECRKALALSVALTRVPDPREASGRRYPLGPVLMLAVLAMLSGMKGISAIAQFGRERGPELARALGMGRETTPCCATLHYLFKKLNAGKFERALQKWLAGRRRDAGWKSLVIDGKVLRGSATQELPGERLLNAYALEAGAVLGQVPVDASTNEFKTALEMLGLMDLKDKVVVGDAMFCQKELSKKVLEGGGDYLWVVKDNQPTLLESIAQSFAPPPPEGGFSPLGGQGPQGPALHRPHHRQGARPGRTADAHRHHGTQRVPGLAGRGPGRRNPA